jgi:monoamine oxidase
MRFPDIPFMKPVFDLIMGPTSPIAGMLTIIPYVMNNPNDLSFYNGIIKTSAELNVEPPPLDPFNTGVNPPDTVSNMIQAAIGDFKVRLRTPPFANGWNYLMQFEEYSTRDYMALVNPRYSDTLINYMETFNSATNLYDESLAETVMDSLDFDYQEGVPTSWVCVQGGAGKIADAMASKLSQTIQRGKRATSIAAIASGSPRATSVNVTVNGEASPRNYHHVISTMPFSCLRMVDTTQCGFNWTFQTAIRALHYDSSVKVAIKFSSRWWEHGGLVNGLHFGGVSSTDRPTRTVVYPSYGLLNEASGATIIVSYSWAQDALRFGALAQGHGSEGESLLLQIIIKDLADMHQVDYYGLWSLIEDYKVHDWYADEYSAGAFALFGPGQFSNLYPEVTKPVGGLLHFAGEAASVHHAWVVGALISAYRTVYEILLHEGMFDLIEKMVSIWGMPDEINVKLLEQQVALGQHMKFSQ